MINRFLIIRLIFLMGNASFAGNTLTALINLSDNKENSEQARSSEDIPAELLQEWEEESINAAEENREPSYLRVI